MKRQWKEYTDINDIRNFCKHVWRSDTVDGWTDDKAREYYRLYINGYFNLR